MLQILINDKYYELAPGSKVQQRQLNPFKAKLGSSGGLEFSDFGEASLEEYHDLRGGIGLESDLPSESNRIHWSEGVDVSTPRSTVLGSLVTTAGSFGAAPVKIIDFQSATYAIGASKISKWNTGTSAWDSKDTSIATPLDALVIQDNTDEYFIVSDATSAKYSTDGTSWSALTDAIGGYMASFAGRLWFISTDGKTVQYSALNDIDDFSDEWVSPTGFSDPDSEWATEERAYDEITEFDTLAYAAVDAAIGINDWGKPLYLTVPAAYYDRIRFYATYNAAAIDSIDLDAYYNAAWNDVYEGAFSNEAWVTKTLSTLEYISQIRIRFYNEDDASTQNATLHEVDIGAAQQFNLTGDFGAVYRLFEGKLLADGSPALYFISNRGLFTIDVDNEKAYQQEVEYPPLTNAGRVGLYWNANVWAATGYGILKVAPATAVHVGPDQDDGLPGGFQGYIYDMVTVNNWLVFCVNGGSTDKSSILKRNATLGGNLQVYTTSATNKAIACLHHSPSSLYTNGRLWWGESTGVKYMMFPDTTSNVKQVSTYEYVAASTANHLQLPIFRKLAAISKTALGVAAITKSCDADEFLTVYYGLNGAAPTTLLGTLRTSPRPPLLTFNSGLGTEFYRIQLAVKFQRSTNTNSPELESLLFYYYPTTIPIHSWTFAINATDEDAETTIADFETLRDTNTLVVFYPTGDPDKTSYNVKLSQLPLEFHVPNQTTRQGRIQVTVKQIFSG